MSDVEINLGNVMELLERAVKERGTDYVDPNSEHGSCEYVENGAPSCIVGHAAFYAGLPVEDLEDAVGAVDEAFGEGSYLAEEGAISISHHAQIVLQAAQRKQDHGSSWGKALEAAREVHAHKLAHVRDTAGVVDE